MPIGEYGASEIQVKQLAKQTAGQKSGGIFGSLKHVHREEQKVSFSVEYHKLQYAKRLMGANSIDELNTKVNTRVTELELLAARGKVKGPSTCDAIRALADYAHCLPGKEIWKMLTLTLEEANPGLRIAPDLARALIVENSPDYTVRKYKEETRELGRSAKISYRAHSISYFRADGTPKEGPEHFVPMLESEIDWNTGIVRGKHLFYMLRYEKDTCVNSRTGAVVNPLFRLNPTPEYEGVGFWFELGDENKLVMKEIELRSHWIAIRFPKELAETTSDGRIKLTSVPDSKYLIKGHMMLVVMKDPEVAFSIIRKLNPQIDALYLKTVIRNPASIGSEIYLWDELLRAGAYWKAGTRYAVRAKLIMAESGKNTEPTAVPLIAKRNAKVK